MSSPNAVPMINGNGNATKGSKDYYSQGNAEVAKVTPVTLKKLETRGKLTKNSTRLVIALVGLPARGKSFVSRKLEAYLNWSGCKCKIFNVGRYRREAYAAFQKEAELSHQQPHTQSQTDFVNNNSTSNNDGSAADTMKHLRSSTGACDANFFDANNVSAAQLREKVAEVALLDMLRWLDDEENNCDDDAASTCDNDASSLPALPFLSSSNNGRDFSGSNATGPSFSRSNSDASSVQQGGNAGGAYAPRLDFHRYERVAIFDATNSTDKRRQWILEQCTSPAKRKDKPTGVVFVESICDDQELLEENYKYKVSSSPDFNNMTREEALQDLRQRVKKYEDQYETITDDSLSYIKVYNLSTKLLVNHIYGRMAKELVPALMAWNIGTRPIFLCRPGQTISGIFTDGEDYVASKKVDPSDPRYLDMSSKTRRKCLRGDSLGPTGECFREELLDYCYDEAHSFMFERASVRDMAYTGTSITGLAESDAIIHHRDSADEGDGDGIADHKQDPFPLRILTSTMPRAIDTVNWTDFKFKINAMSNLNPLDKGDFAGMELDEIRKTNPTWYSKLEKDAFDTRFPGGESYRDLIRRLTSVVIDLEQQVIPTLVVSHVSILQCLIAYFNNTPVEECMSIEVPLHTVIKFTPVRGGGWKESRIRLCDAEGINNHVVTPPSAMYQSTLPLPVTATGVNGASVATISVKNAFPQPSNNTTKSSRNCMTPVESASEISALSMGDYNADTIAHPPKSPIWGDHMMATSRTVLR